MPKTALTLPVAATDSATPAKKGRGPGRPFAKGPDPRRGGGLKGRSGRKSNAWLAACEQALTDAKALQVVSRIVSGDIQEQLGTTPAGQPIIGETRNADRLGAVKFLASYAHGEPTKDVDWEGELTIRVVRDGE